MERDFRKQAVNHLYGWVKNSVSDFLEYYCNETDAYAGENVTSLDQVKTDADWGILCQEYIRSNVANELKDEIGFDRNPVYLKWLLTYAGRVFEIIDGNVEHHEYGREELMRWDFVYESLIGELEKLFGGKIKVWVNVYHITREFGGHEEGGWWYNWYECVESHEAPWEQGVAVYEKLEKEHGKGEGNIYSSLGGYEVDIRIEDFPKQSESTERPFYC